MVCTGGRTILSLCLAQKKKKLGANMVASILLAGLEKDTDIYPFSVLGDLPSQSLQEVLLHEQENQPNPVGLPGGRG